MSTFTISKGFELPANGADVDTWDVPVNADFTAVDTCLGGLTTINVVSASGTVTLSQTQYRPPCIIFSGLLTANVNYQLPTTVGGFWFLLNNTTGAFTITFSSAGAGASITVPQGYPCVALCDGTNVRAWTGTAAIQNIGTSGATVPLMSNSNTFTQPQIVQGSVSGGLVVPLLVANVATLTGTNLVGLRLQTQGFNTSYVELFGSEPTSGYTSILLRNSNNGVQQTALSLDSSRVLTLPGYGAGTLSTNASGVVSATSDAGLKNIVGPYGRGLADLQKMELPILYTWIAEQAAIQAAIIAIPTLTDAAADAQSAADQAPPETDEATFANQALADAQSALEKAQYQASLALMSTYVGWTAQGVAAGLPEAVSIGPDGKMTVNDRAIIAAQLNAILQLAARVAALEAKVS